MQDYLTIDMPDGDAIDVEVSFNISREWYGADADGNRGCLRTTIEDLEITPDRGKYVREAVTEKLYDKLIDYVDDYE